MYVSLDLRKKVISLIKITLVIVLLISQQIFVQVNISDFFTRKSAFLAKIQLRKMHLSIKSLEKMRTFTACFRSEGPLQICGPELKTKLHDPFEPFSASYHVLLVNRVSEVSAKSTTFDLIERKSIFKILRCSLLLFSHLDTSPSKSLAPYYFGTTMTLLQSPKLGATNYLEVIWKGVYIQHFGFQGFEVSFCLYWGAF